MEFFEQLYPFLARMGYAHPLHPALVPLPMGLVLGAFVFAVIGGVARRYDMAQSARHCMILALIMVPPTVFLGLMDWYHYYRFSWLWAIKVKIILAGLLFLFLLLAVALGRKHKIGSNRLFLVHLICVLTVIGLGFFGGELVFGKTSQSISTVESAVDHGRELFRQDCAACHFADSNDDKIGPGLRGLFKMARFPSSGLAVSEENFRRLLQNPPEGMPAFNELTHDEVTDLIDYLRKTD
jgi:cytochrome c2